MSQYVINYHKSVQAYMVVCIFTTMKELYCFCPELVMIKLTAGLYPSL